MPRCVRYQVLDTPDGRFAVATTIEPGPTFFRTDFATRAEAEDWIEGLQMIMAAIGAPVSLAFPEQTCPLPLDVLLSLMHKPSPEAG